VANLARKPWPEQAVAEFRRIASDCATIQELAQRWSARCPALALHKNGVRTRLQRMGVELGRAPAIAFVDPIVEEPLPVELPVEVDDEQTIREERRQQTVASVHARVPQAVAQRPALKQALLLPDAHVPYHCKTAFGLLHQIARSFPFASMNILGDWFDMWAVSDFSKNPLRKLDLQNELDQGQAEAGALRQTQITYQNPDCEFDFGDGNHEFRIMRYISKRPELVNMRSMSIAHLVNEVGWKWRPYDSHVKLGRWLKATHDFGDHGGYALLRAPSKYGSAVVFVHTHQAGIIYRSDVSGNNRASMNAGWLGDVEQLDYGKRDSARQTHQLGVGLVTYGPNEFYYLEFIPFFWELDADGKKVSLNCCFNGAWFSQQRIV